MRLLCDYSLRMFCVCATICGMAVVFTTAYSFFGGITVCTFIGIESLAANALIEIMQNTNRREVDFETLVKYGMRIVKLLLEQTGDEAILLMSRKYQIGMVENYSHYFIVEARGSSNDIFKLKDGVTVDDLSNYFRWTMKTKIIKAFLAKEALMELGVVA